MTARTVSRPLEEYLNADQRRIATNSRGAQVWVRITPDDRLKVINELEHRWPEIVKAREAGETIEEIHRRLRVQVTLTPTCHPACSDAYDAGHLQACHGECDPPCFRDLLAAAYAKVETRLHELARRRGWLMP